MNLVPLPGDGVPVTTVPVPNRLAVPVSLAGQQAGTRTATLEQLRERLESGEPPEKKAPRLSEEEQRLVQQAFQRSLFTMARQLPMKIRINGREDRSEASAAALNLATGSIGSINMSVDIDGTTYAGKALGAARGATAWWPWLALLVTFPSESLPGAGFLICSLNG